MTIKDTLHTIKENNYILPAGLQEYDLIKQTVGVLGSTDPELRDELGYTVLQKLLVGKKLLTHEQLKELLQAAISDNMLFKGIGDAESDSVFLRTFSSLLIALILIRDNQEEFLNAACVRQVVNSLVSYCHQEKDLRGYVELQGWAHAAAHVSDAIHECVRSRYIQLEECKFLWSGLCTLFESAAFVFGAEEDERIATAVTAMVELEKVPVAVLCEWLLDINAPHEYTLRNFYRRINYKNFVRSLCMRLLHKGLLPDEQQLLSVEHKFNRYCN